MTTKRSGKYLLACGHTVRAALDTQSRTRCSKCEADTYVIREVRR